MPDYPPFHARLNFPSSWCPATNTNAWIQVDLERALLVKGIATQGHYGRLSTAMVSSYSVSFANESSGSFTFIRNGSQNKVQISSIGPPSMFSLVRYVMERPWWPMQSPNKGKKKKTKPKEGGGGEIRSSLLIVDLNDGKLRSVLI